MIVEDNVEVKERDDDKSGFEIDGYSDDDSRYL